MSSDAWTLLVIAVIANAAFIGYLLYVVQPWKKQPEPPKRTSRPHGEYGQGIVSSHMQDTWGGTE